MGGAKCRLAHPAGGARTAVNERVPKVVRVDRLHLHRADWQRWWIDVRIVDRSHAEGVVAQCVHSKARIFIHFRALPQSVAVREEHARSNVPRFRAALKRAGNFYRISGGELARVTLDDLDELDDEARDVRHQTRREYNQMTRLDRDDDDDDDFYREYDDDDDEDDFDDDDDGSDTPEPFDLDEEYFFESEAPDDMLYHEPEEDRFFTEHDVFHEVSSCVDRDLSPQEPLALFLTGSTLIVPLPKVLKPAPAPAPVRAPAPAVARAAPAAPAAPLCKFFARGKCQYGNKCRFSHAAAAALPHVVPATAAAAATAAVAAGAADPFAVSREYLCALVPVVDDDVEATPTGTPLAATAADRLEFPRVAGQLGAAFTRAKARELRELARLIAAPALFEVNERLADGCDDARSRLEEEFIDARFRIGSKY